MGLTTMLYFRLRRHISSQICLKVSLERIYTAPKQKHYLTYIRIMKWVGAPYQGLFKPQDAVSGQICYYVKGLGKTHISLKKQNNAKVQICPLAKATLVSDTINLRGKINNQENKSVPFGGCRCLFMFYCSNWAVTASIVSFEQQPTDGSCPRC